MKIKNLILPALLVLGLASCDEVSNGLVQTNPQLPVFPADGIAVTTVMPEALDLTALNETATPIQVGTVTLNSELPEGYELTFLGQICRDDAFAKTADVLLSYSPDDNVISVSADDFEGAYIAIMGKSAKTKNVFFRAVPYASSAVRPNEFVRLGGENVFFCQKEVAVTPYDLNIVIEDAYYLYGTINGWDMATALPFKHSGLDPYDDPVFTKTVTIDVSNAQSGWWWKVMAGSTFAAQEEVQADNAFFGVADNGDSALEGLLIPTKVSEADGTVTNPGAGCVKEVGVFDLTLDMEAQTYDFKRVIYPMFMMGNVFGTNIKKVPWIMSPDNSCFFGLFNLDGEFSIYSDTSDNPVIYGAGPDGTIVAGGEPFSAEAGFYAIRAQLGDGKFIIEPVETIGLIGEFNEWGAQVNLKNMSEGKGNGTWRGRVTLDGNAFKIRINDNWDLNLGGNVNALTVNGDDISGYEAGEYNVTLRLDTNPYTIELVKR